MTRSQMLELILEFKKLINVNINKRHLAETITIKSNIYFCVCQ